MELKKYNIVLSILFFVCIAIGVGLELLFGETGPNKGMMFQRSGALIVLLGSAYGLVDGATLTQMGKLYSQAEIDEMNAAANNLERSVFFRFELIMRIMDARSLLFKYSVYVLMLGTVVWGFGDIAYRLIAP